MTRRPSLRASIDNMCRQCIHDPYGGGGHWREQVQACSSSNCPLHAVCPVSKGRVTATSAAEDDYGEPDLTDEAAEDVGALLGGLFGRDGAE